jgi:hypothetical protein
VDSDDNLGHRYSTHAGCHWLAVYIVFVRRKGPGAFKLFTNSDFLIYYENISSFGPYRRL